MGRVPSGISYEIKKNSVKGVYNPEKAQRKARVKRYYAGIRRKKIPGNIPLRDFIENALSQGHSPREVSGRLKCREVILGYVGERTIEKYLKSPYGKLFTYPWKKKKYRKRGIKKQQREERIKDKKMIEKRPIQAHKRQRIGDFEGDFIVSGKTGKGALLVIVDRKARYVLIEQILEITVDNVHEAFQRMRRRLKKKGMLMHTLTLDNDILFQAHKVLEKLLKVKIYFCHPYHSWEKGSVENANKYIRRFIKKGSDISRYTREEIQEVEDYLNNRWMECLRFKSPNEVVEEYAQEKKKSHKKTAGKAGWEDSN